MANTISTSVKYGLDVIMGQNLTLDIILKSDNVISNDANIDIITKNGIELQRNIPPITLHDGGKVGFFSVELFVDDNVPENNSVLFDIIPNSEAKGFHKTSMLYYAKTVDISSVKLEVGVDYIKMPTSLNIPPSGQLASKISTTIKSRDGKTNLSGTPVTVLDTSGNFDKVNFYSSDKKEKLQVRDIGNKRGLIINTDSNGRLVFYVYAKQDSSVVLNLVSKIVGVTGEISADKALYIIDSGRTDPNYIVDEPIISGEHQGILRSDGNSSKFSVTIPKYDNAEDSDTIFFFINGLMTDVPFYSDPENLGTPFIQLPYSVFLEPNKPVNFYYVIIKDSAERLVSDSIQVTYVKDETPLDNVYEKCKVYSSQGTNDNDLVTEDYVIACKDISNYKNNTGDAGLFVKITGTNDPNDATKVPLGSEVTLYLHIRSDRKKLDLPIKLNMPTDAGNDGKTNFFIQGITQTYLVGISEVDTDNPGKIYFSYSIKNTDDRMINSKAWKGKIDTHTDGPWPECE
ncbi:hypothetical protein [Xenorhabdus lircayensis]|uniref:Inverse autotransporter beta-barrel domain-containing protein n=1 Tax=Xenorhabdus lircayensis TaxID=2763499 RepID=A0ABS0U1D5_9GAMM|nr:hypothetical protein [Xenorhabdus lircayensis]MBI6547693.1 hypothetical protein [Xenorhabdus lircayensis]